MEDCRWFHVADHALLPLGTTTAGKPILEGVGELRSRQQGEGVVQHANRESHLYHEARGRLMTIACAAASFEPVVHTLATPSPLPPSLSLSLSTCIDNFYPPIVDLWLNPRCPGRPIVWLCYFATRAYDLALFTRLPTFVDLFQNAFSIRPIKSFRQLRAVSTVPSINVFISLWIFLRHFGWEHAIVLRHLLRF